MTEKSLIAHISFEVAPFSKHGGLADVVGALPVYLQSAALDNIVLSPFYYGAMAEEHAPVDTGRHLLVPYSGKVYEVSVLALEHRGIRCLFLAEPTFFDRNDIYHRADGKPYEDGTERGAFFAKAVWHCIRDVIGGADHVVFHDWHGAALLAYFVEAYPRPKTTYIIHNFQFQGQVHPSLLPTLDPPLSAALGGLADAGQTPSLAALALNLCDHVVTVSPSYREELVAGSLPLHATSGLFTELVQRKLHGFLNGIDVATWGRPTERTPEEHLAIIRREKSEAAAIVRAQAGLLEGRPLALMMCRLVRQKGIDLFFGEGEALLPRILHRFNIVVCGQPGEDPERVDSGFRRLAAAHPGAFAYLSAYDDELGKRLFKAADIFLFPSLFEPCGLTQMYAMAQGTIPVARATGGLKDTIIDEATQPGRGTGFLFADFSPETFFTTLERAGKVLANTDRWTALMLRAMAEDHSWERRAAPYRALFSGCPAEGLS